MKTAIITGASRGIGAATAEKLAQKGYLVIVNYNNSRDCAQKLCDKINSSGGMAVCYKADVARPEEVKAMTDFAVKTYGGIDLAVANAGIGKISMLTDTSDEEIDRLLDVNLKGVIVFVKECAKNMLARHKGNIVTVASMWGQVGASCESVYSAAKGGVIAFTKALAKEFGVNGIRVNCVSPGLIDTDINSNLTSDDKRALAQEIPLGRIGLAEDVANAICWLADDESGYVTGQVLPVNGGMVI